MFKIILISIFARTFLGLDSISLWGEKFSYLDLNQQFKVETANLERFLVFSIWRIFKIMTTFLKMPQNAGFEESRADC